MQLRTHSQASRLIKFAAAVGIAALGLVSQAQAGVIRCATSATILSGGPGFGTLTETFNGAGLSTGRTCGVTDFDTYIASGPSHTFVFSGFEWFSNVGTTSASVVYNLGSLWVIDAMALWNEESSGIGRLNLSTSTDGVNFTALAGGLVPTDHDRGDASYFADVFSFGPVSARYIRMDMLGCPQPNSDFNSCAIGEVMWRESNANQVPEPATLALIALAALAGGAARRRSMKRA